MTTPAPPACIPCPPQGMASGLLMCDIQPDGTVIQFLRIFLSSGGTQDVTLDREPYTPTGDVGTCGGDCESVTTPVAAVAHLCLADGTPIAVVVQRDCDGTISSPGWVNMATGTYTEGTVPDDAAACDQTVTGGSADRIALCDVQDDGTVVGFLRAIGADGTLTDTTIDGQPYTPTGTPQMCDALAASEAIGCASPTTPVATTGLCLADSTPIAVTIERDCDGVTIRTGWLDLVTGTWSSGAPPEGTRACGETSAFDVSGVLCDVNPADSTVFGLVLIEVERGPDGEVTGTRLLSAADGAPYVLQGELSVCPTGIEQPEKDLVVLCDVSLAGEVTTFVRDFQRDGNGAITGHTDYDLEGAAYTPTGVVQSCATAAEEPCRNPTSVLLCDVSTTDSVTVLNPAEVAGADGWQVITFVGANPDGQPEAPLPYAAFHSAAGGGRLGARSNFSAGTGTGGSWSGYDSAPVRWVIAKTFDAAEDGIAVIQASSFRGDGGARVRVNGQDVGIYGQWNQPATGGSAQVPVTAGPNVVEIEVRDTDGPNWVAGRLDVTFPVTTQFVRTLVTDCVTGEVVATTDATLDGQPYEVTGEVGQCASTGCTSCSGSGDCQTTSQTLKLCDLNPGMPPDGQGRICAVPFLRTLVHDCTGAVVASVDTTLDGETPYQPVQVVDCSSGTPALTEVPWSTVNVAEEPGGRPQQDFIFQLSPANDPTQVGEVRVALSTQAGGACGPYDLDNLIFSNPTTYTFTLDETARSMSTFVVYLQDFDTFEPVTGFSPPPDRIGGTAAWDPSGALLPTESNGVGIMYWDNPPETIRYRIGNTGGGTSCSMLDFTGITFAPEGCCGCSDMNSPEPDPAPVAETMLLVDLGNPLGGALPTAFMRVIVRDVAGVVVSVTDTGLDGVTPYVVQGQVTVPGLTGLL